MRRLFGFLSGAERLVVGLCVILVMAQVWLDLKIPDTMSELTRIVQTPGSSVSEILRAGSPMLGYSLASMVVSLVVGFIAAQISARLAHRIRRNLYEKTLEFSMEEIHRFSAASLITRSSNDITQVQVLVAMMLQMFLRAPLMAVWAVVKIFGKQWQWTAATGAAVGVLVILLAVIMSVALPRFRRIQSLTDDVNRVTREELSGIRVVRAFGAQELHQEKFQEANDALTENNLTAHRMMALIFPGMGFINTMLTLAVYWLGAQLIDAAAIDLRLGIFADMVVFSSYAMQVIMSFMLLNIIFILLPRAQVAAARILEVLDTKISIVDGALGTDVPEEGRIEFQNVSFTYPDARHPSVEDISFTVNPGETLAIIGATGSGKSTLLHLLMRFYDVTSGRILVDGVNLKDFSLDALRTRLGFVPQKAFLFSGTVKDTVAYGKKASENEVNKALAIAQADFVKNLDGGLDAPIAQGGTNVSGGQRQRLAIARAIGKHPEILLFDDSFSALDYKTDKALRHALEENLEEVTKIIVAQRISTIQHADQILVLEHGRIVGRGRHEELLASCPVYQEIAQSQLSKEELAHA